MSSSSQFCKATFSNGIVVQGASCAGLQSCERDASESIVINGQQALAVYRCKPSWWKILLLIIAVTLVCIALAYTIKAIVRTSGQSRGGDTSQFSSPPTTNGSFGSSSDLSSRV